jgi:hypothetical protein
MDLQAGSVNGFKYSVEKLGIIIKDFRNRLRSFSRLSSSNLAAIDSTLKCFTRHGIMTDSEALEILTLAVIKYLGTIKEERVPMYFEAELDYLHDIIVKENKKFS